MRMHMYIYARMSIPNEERVECRTSKEGADKFGRGTTKSSKRRLERDIPKLHLTRLVSCMPIAVVKMSRELLYSFLCRRLAS